MLNPFALRYIHLWLSPRCMSKCQKRKVAVAWLDSGDGKTIKYQFIASF